MALTRRRSSLYDGIEYGGLPVRPVIDEFAYARTHSDHDSNTALFEVISRRYLKSSTIITPHPASPGGASDSRPDAGRRRAGSIAAHRNDVPDAVRAANSIA